MNQATCWCLIDKNHQDVNGKDQGNLWFGVENALEKNKALLVVAFHRLPQEWGTLGNKTRENQRAAAVAVAAAAALTRAAQRNALGLLPICCTELKTSKLPTPKYL